MAPLRPLQSAETDDRFLPRPRRCSVPEVMAGQLRPLAARGPMASMRRLRTLDRKLIKQRGRHDPARASGRLWEEKFPDGYPASTLIEVPHHDRQRFEKNRY